MALLVIEDIQQFRNVIREEIAAALLGQSPANELPETKQDFITMKAAKKLLLSKGYKANSYNTIMRIVSDNGVKVQKKGGENWLELAALNDLPNKI